MVRRWDGGTVGRRDSGTAGRQGAGTASSKRSVVSGQWAMVNPTHLAAVGRVVILIVLLDGDVGQMDERVVHLTNIRRVLHIAEPREPMHVPARRGSGSAGCQGNE